MKMERSDYRILISVDRWHRESPGDARRLTGRWAEWLAKSGYRVSLVAGRNENSPPPASPLGNLSLHTYPNPAAPSPSLHNMRAHVQATRAIVRELRREGRFHLHHGHAPLHFLGACDALKGPFQKHLYTAHAPYAHDWRARWAADDLTTKRRLAWGLARWLESMVLARATRIHVLSRYTRRMLSAPLFVRDNKYRQVPGAISKRAPQNPDSAEIATWQRGRPTFLALRRLEARMGLGHLLDACRLLRNARREFCLMIVGSGTERSTLEAHARALKLEDSVRFVGPASEAALETFYAQANCGILPATGLESFGLTILDAHLRELPIIATPVGALPETIGPWQQAWITDSARGEDIAARMADYLDGKLLFDAKQVRNRAETYVEDRMFARWEEELLQPLLPRRRWLSGKPVEPAFSASTPPPPQAAR